MKMVENYYTRKSQTQRTQQHLCFFPYFKFHYKKGVRMLDAEKRARFAHCTISWNMSYEKGFANLFKAW